MVCKDYLLLNVSNREFIPMFPLFSLVCLLF
ncbi:hypothetical protein [Klebsiella phage vB_KpnS_Uniso31]|uniref:Uncharacterized protein n=1 Tax=Klebsiella phage vB_KpnS_Uniso31 TaxID=2951200 RepID=A0A9E7NGI7_9CAUD|nr:hypothetical protein [Klebsiella phage vB_KpnS_Uniso31]